MATAIKQPIPRYNATMKYLDWETRTYFAGEVHHTIYNRMVGRARELNFVPADMRQYFGDKLTYSLQLQPHSELPGDVLSGLNTSNWKHSLPGIVFGMDVIERKLAHFIVARGTTGVQSEAHARDLLKNEIVFPLYDALYVHDNPLSPTSHMATIGRAEIFIFTRYHSLPADPFQAKIYVPSRIRRWVTDRTYFCYVNLRHRPFSTGTKYEATFYGGIEAEMLLKDSGRKIPPNERVGFNTTIEPWMEFPASALSKPFVLAGRLHDRLEGPLSK